MSEEKQESFASENKKMFIFGLIGFLLVVFVLLLGVSLFRVYRKMADDSFTMVMAKTLRLPALKVADNVILYGDFIDDMKAIKKVRDYDINNNGPMAQIT